MMHGREKSDPSMVAGKPTNNSEGAEAESVERREGTKGNTVKHGTRRTLSRACVFPGLERVRERAGTEKKERFTALLHHVDIDLLRAAFSWLKRDAAPGVDGRPWRQLNQLKFDRGVPERIILHVRHFVITVLLPYVMVLPYVTAITT